MTRLYITLIQLCLIVILYAQEDKAITTIESNLTSAVQVKGRPIDKITIQEWMEKEHIPNLSIAVIVDGKIAWTKGYGIANPETGQQVNSSTIFQAASISKPIAAVGVHKQVQEGKLDLDIDVNEYLTSWKVPDSRFTQEKKVTLRGLMTHSAGVTVHGFPGYTSEDKFPSDIEVLNGNGNTAAILVDTFPGSLNRYSGGGYTIMERVIEDMTGHSFDDYMLKEVLIPFGMNESTYTQPLPEEKHHLASVAFNGEGAVYPGDWHSHPEQAAAGLWTTPSDLAKFIIGISAAYQGKTDQVINQETAEVFLTRHELGHGHGPGLMGDDERKLFGHGGKNAGFTCHMIGSATENWGIAVMTGADNGWNLINAVERAIAEYYQWNWAQAEVVDVKPITIEELQKYTGKYIYRPNNIIARVYIEDGMLKLSDPQDQIDMLEHLGDHRFIILKGGIRMEFFQDDKGKITRMVQDGRYSLDRIE